MQIMDNKEVIQRFIQAVSGNEKTAQVVDEYVTDEALRQHIQVFEAAFPRYELVVEDIIADGGKVAVRIVFKGTHQGEFMGKPPTGKTVSIPVAVIYEVSDGKITDHWILADQLGLMQQLGVMPS